jgi:2-keto-4-pentenoate hydratase
MDGDDHSIAATSLRAAYGGPAIEPLTRTFPGMTVDDAYTVQQLQVQAWQSQGRSVIGHKVGLTSRAMRRQLGVDQPDYGRLTADMVFAEGEALQPERFLQPKVEPEIAFVLGADLTGPGVTVVQAIRAVDHVLPAIEVIDSRIRDWEIALVDTIADNASSAAVVLGSRPVRLADVDLRLTGCVLTGERRGRRHGCRRGRCSDHRSPRWCGSPTSWDRGASGSRPVRWSSRARSPQRSR